MKKETAYGLWILAGIFVLMFFIDKFWLTKTGIFIDVIVKRYIMGSYPLAIVSVFAALLFFDITIDLFKGRLARIFK